MKNFSKLCALLPAAAVVLSLAACGGGAVKGPIASQAPDWVNRGSGAFKDGGEGVFYSVGIVQGIRNRALSVVGADERARENLARVMNDYVTALLKSYMASTTAGDMSKSDEEQHVSDTLKTFAKFTLHGSTIIDHWKDPTDGTMFALCKLDMKTVNQALADSKELDSKVRDYVKANAEKAFDELQAEESKAH